MDQTVRNRILALKDQVVANFNRGNWEEIGLITGESDLILEHDRLLRSLRFGDDDYEGNALTVLRVITQRGLKNLELLEQYMADKYPKSEGTYISAKPSERKITFAPNVFRVPEESPEADLVTVMMPMAREFDPVLEAVKRACKATSFRCLRVDDIWDDSTIIQDIFNLIFRAHVVVVDFTNKNPNVMYETGIAHTLGKHVVPISQSVDDVPFDTKHHRVLKYLPNTQGLDKLQQDLEAKLIKFRPEMDWLKWAMS